MQKIFHTYMQVWESSSNYRVSLHGQWLCFNLVLLKHLRMCLGMAVFRIVYE